MPIRVSLCVALLLLLPMAGPAFALALFGTKATSPQWLRSIDYYYGHSTGIGPIGLGSGVRSMEFVPEVGLLAADTSNDQLILIDRRTGAGSFIGPLGSGFVTGLAFDGNTETLYGVDWNTQELLSIDIATGASTALVDLDFGGIITDLAFDSKTNILYGMENMGPSGSEMDRLVTIDPASGTGTVIGETGFYTIRDLTFDKRADTILAIDGLENSLISIDLETGVGVWDRPFRLGGGGGGTGSVAFVPEPSTALLLACGLAALAARRRH